MKNIKNTIVLFGLIIGFSSCNTKPKEDVITYTVTPEFCKLIDKPEVHFTVNIPKTLHLDKPKTGKKNSSYGMIQEKDNDSIVTEMYSFGYIASNGITIEEGGKSFMIQIKNMLKNAGYKIEEDTIGMTNFDGKSYMSLNMIGTMEQGLSDLFIGRYYFNIVAKPNPNGNTHILMLMAAREDQGITTYEDFKDKLSISTVWKTFKYL